MQSVSIVRSAEQVAQVRKATTLLRKAIGLLEACGVASAVDHGRLALSATVAAVEEHKTQRVAAQVRQRVEPSMPRDEKALIREDGTLRFVSYMKSSGNRPEVIAVSFRVPDLPSFTTSFTLVGRNFDDVYEVAVRALAQNLGVLDDLVLIEAMLCTRNAFKARYGLQPQEQVNQERKHRDASRRVSHR